MHATDKEYNVASELLAVGVDSTDENSSTAYLRGLFLLSRAMVLMIDRKMGDVPTLFHQASLVIESAIQNVHLKEYLKVFYLVLQVSCTSTTIEFISGSGDLGFWFRFLNRRCAII